MLLSTNLALPKYLRVITLTTCHPMSGKVQLLPNGERAKSGSQAGRVGATSAMALSHCS